jgi:long-chain acyl-CoA synthetase
VALIYPRDPTLPEAAIEQINAGLPDYARILNWCRLDQSLNNHAGMLTDNGRPVRAAIAAHYQHHLDSLYQQQTPTLSLEETTR